MFDAAAARLSGLGYGLLLAHPERAAGGHERLRAARRAGRAAPGQRLLAARQPRPDAQELAAELVRTGLAYCLASDGHPGTREHTLQLGFHLLIRAGAPRAGLAADQSQPALPAAPKARRG